MIDRNPEPMLPWGDADSCTNAADKAYDSNRNHHLLNGSGIRSAIILKRNRLGHPLGGRKADRWIRDDQRKRRRIEPKVAEL